uniref:Hyaluronan mediated motility receptor n=1 Tax=Daphnia magna TaxID=35525 RepID=A0A0P6G4U3_9CRUS
MSIELPSIMGFPLSDDKIAFICRLEAALKQANDEKKEMEAQISEFSLKIENLENVRVELVKEIDMMKESFQRDLNAQEIQHKTEVEAMQAANKEQVQQLENNLQQLVAEHDAESEQIKFEYGKQIDELHQNHATTLSQLANDHSTHINDLQLSHQEQISRLESSRDEIEAERLHLHQKCEQIGVTLETKMDEIETLKVQLDVAEEKLETSRVQAEDKYSSMKRSLELDIAECQTRSEEQRRSEQEKLRSDYESKLMLLEQNHLQLTEQLRAQQEQFEEAEKAHILSCSQYDEKLKRLNDNNQTEKEILMWQMSQQRENLELELKTEFENRLCEKEADFERQRANWETQMNEANEDHANQLATLQSNHSVQLNNYRELHEAALETLEREKKDILEVRALVEKNLQIKEAEIEKVTSEMKEAVNKLQLDLEMLRESNSQLVADVLRVEQERIMTEEKIEVEKVQMKAQAEQEKELLVKSYENVIDSIRSEATRKEEQVSELVSKLSVNEETLQKELEKKEKEIEDIKITHEDVVSQMSIQHLDEIKTLHKNYEKVIAAKEEKFIAEREQLSAVHHETVEALKGHNLLELQKLQEAFRMTFTALERKLEMEKEDLARAHAKELAELNSSYESKMEAVNKHHEAVVEKLNKNYEEAMDNSQELQQSLDYLRLEFQAVLAAAESKEAHHKAEVEKMTHAIQFKENEITHLGETLRRREKETADEWIQRETSIMAQLTEQNQKSVQEFESHLQEIRAQLQQSKEETVRIKEERDVARDDVAVFQVQTEAQLAALSEQYDQERAMLIEKLSVQTREIEEINSTKIQDLQTQLAESQRDLEEIRWASLRQIEKMEHDHEEAILTAVREALEPVDNELESLRKDREAYLLLKKEYQDLQARIEPFRDQLEMYEAEKKALLSQALFAESSMASLAAKYTQLLGHQNSKQKIHHLDKLKQDIFNLRKELAEKNLALEKEKKARQKADARVKELSGQKKYDPAEAFKVPENPAAASIVNKAPPKLGVAKLSAVPSPAAVSKEAGRQQRKPLRPQGQATGFFLSMDDIEKERAEMEQEKQLQMDSRRKASANFEAFEVDFSTSSSRRETFDIPSASAKQLNVTRNMTDTKQNNKENINQGLFPNDLSDISVSDELLLKNKLKSRVDHLTSTPLQRHT